MKFIHIADIHFRGLTRHSEYRKVFERFFSQAREIKPDYIFVGGDIVHSKTQGITPELIDILTWWFKELASIADTHIVLGNHDGIILNPDRQDAITPIVTAIGDSKLHLYKRSGTYPIDDKFALCVFSCFDEHGWSAVKPLDGYINIASFHGSVTSSVTDIGWELEGDVDISFFENYDFVFLGDIHKQQFLRWREISPGVVKPDMGFSGSTVQQNHGEDPEKGFLLWDIRSRDDFDVTFHTVKGENPFQTIEWKGTVEDTVEHAKSLVSSQARLRVKTPEKIPHVLWSRLTDTLQCDLNLEEITLQSDISNVNVTDESTINTFSTDTISRYNLVSTQLDLLRQFYGASDSNFTDADWTLVENILTNCLTDDIKLPDIAYGTKWELERLEFDNTFSFGTGNVLDLTKLGGITGIFGKNAAGKSSLVGTLMYNLFNGTDRGSIRNLNVVNEKEQHCISRALIKINNERVKIERQTVKRREKSGIDGALTYLNVFKVDAEGNTIEDLSGEQRRDSEQYLRTRLGTGDDFTITSLCTQGDTAAFVKFKNTARKTILTRLLGLDIFEKICETLKSKSSELQSSLKKMSSRDWDAMIKERTAKISSNQEEIENLSIRHSETATKLQRLNAEYNSLDHDSDTAVQLQGKQKKLQDVNAVLLNLESVRSKLLKEKQSKVLELEALAQEPDHDTQVLKQQIREKKDIESEFTDVKHTLDKLKETLRQKTRSAKTLDQVPCGTQFPTCKFIKDSHVDKLELPKLEAQIDDITHSLDNIARKLSAYRQFNSEQLLEQQERKDKKHSGFKLDVAVLSGKISEVEKKIDDCKKLVVDLEKSVQQLQLKLDLTEQSKITSMQSEIATLSDQLKTLDRTRLELSSDNGKLAAVISGLQRERESYSKLNTEWKIYDKLIHAYSKRGIPLLIVASKLPTINAEIANILQGIVNFTVELETDVESNEMDVYINYGETRRYVELGSGMEKMISAIAIRVALINASCLPKSDIFIIDEGFGVLDDDNLEACSRFLTSLKRWFRCVLIITHIDGIKDAVDNVIEITRRNSDEYTKISVR